MKSFPPHSFAALVAVILVATPPSKAAEGGGSAPSPDLLLGDGPEVAQARVRLSHGDADLAALVRILVGDANSVLNSPIASIVDKAYTPPSGDKHDYFSLAPYWWPNPQTADRLPYVWRDGVSNPERGAFDYPKLVSMTRAVTILGPAYYYTGDERYAENAAQRLRVWFLDPATRMNPNLKYCQVRRGQHSRGRGSSIEAIRFRWLVDAVVLLRGSPHWTAADDRALRDWFGNLARWMATSPDAIAESASANNHGSWYAEQVVDYALFAGDTKLAREQLSGIAPRILSQIMPDGTEPHELTRTKALHYSNFNNLGLLDLVRLGRRLDAAIAASDSEAGLRLRCSLAHLAPYVTGTAIWRHQQTKSLDYSQIAETYWIAAATDPDPSLAGVLDCLPGGARPPVYVQLMLPLSQSVARPPHR